jgi:hypothetical protein
MLLTNNAKWAKQKYHLLILNFVSPLVKTRTTVIMRKIGSTWENSAQMDLHKQHA